ncbi:lytic murein transglycosylase [Patescibacteria group bacterium]|nr:lytic murein transglycosylase [Patescibacteria group bacterium]
MQNDKSKFKIILNHCLLLVIVLLFVLLNFKILAEEDLEEICQLERLEQKEETLSKEDYRRLLEKCQKYYEEISSQIETDIQKTEKEKKTLQNQIYILKNKIKNLDYQIYQSNLMVKDLGLQIEDTEISIEKTSLKIEDSKEKLANILRLIYEEDQKTIIEILLSGPKLSDFFENLMALEAISLKNQELLKEIKTLKSYLENQKESLDTEKGDLEKLAKIQQLQKQESESTKKEQEYFLKLTETEYQKYLREKEEAEKRTQEIRARIFELIGIPEAPTFGEAYELAKYVEGVTGVRPALLLAVLTQESNIGKNVGQCYLKNPKTGEGVNVRNGKKLARVMKPSRDIPPFLNICKELGRDPYNTPVSCPMSYGWGGAMGPAQFIPSTWVLYKEKVRAITGSADPWNIKDSFVAAALYLANFGATKQTYNAEWKAVMIYFSGSTNKKFRFYGDSVMKIASQYAKDIREIERLAKL